MTQVERDEHAAIVARQSAEAALCHLAYRNGLQLSDERMDAEVTLLSDVLLQHLHKVEIRTLIGTRVPCPSEVRAAAMGHQEGYCSHGVPDGVACGQPHCAGPEYTGGDSRRPRRIPGAVTRA